MSNAIKTSSRSAGQWIVAGIFGLLSVAFLFRAVQFGVKWLRHSTEGGANFKALTLWALVYVIVCGAIASVAWFMPRDEVAATDPIAGAKSE